MPMLMYRKNSTPSGRNHVEMSPLLCKKFHKFTCIINDCEARENTHNCENLQKCVLNRCL